LPTPSWDNRPQLMPELAWVLEAFQMLSAHRQSSGFGMSPLSIADIEAYCRLIGLETEGRVKFLDMVTSLDTAFLQWSVEERGNEKASDP